jgi:hypothetical protein
VHLFPDDASYGPAGGRRTWRPRLPHLNRHHGRSCRVSEARSRGERRRTVGRQAPRSRDFRCARAHFCPAAHFRGPFGVGQVHFCPAACALRAGRPGPPCFAPRKYGGTKDAEGGPSKHLTVSTRRRSSSTSPKLPSRMTGIRRARVTRRTSRYARRSPRGAPTIDASRLSSSRRPRLSSPRIDEVVVLDGSRDREDYRAKRVAGRSPVRARGVGTPPGRLRRRASQLPDPDLEVRRHRPSPPRTRSSSPTEPCAIAGARATRAAPPPRVPRARA